MATDVLDREVQDRDTFRLLVVLSLTFIYLVFIISFFGLYVTVLLFLLVENNYGSERFYCHAYWLAVSLFWILVCIVVLPIFKDNDRTLSMHRQDQSPESRPNVEAGVWRGPLLDNVATCSEIEEDRRTPPPQLEKEFKVILESTNRVLAVLEEVAEATDEEDGERKSVKLECPILSHEIPGNEHFTATEGENDPQTTEEEDAKETKGESDEVFDDVEVTENRPNLMDDDVVNELENKMKVVVGSEGFNETEVETLSQDQPLPIQKAEGRETYCDDLLSNTDSKRLEISSLHPLKVNKVFLFINTEEEGGISES